uniref:Ribosomal RNA-processing protein 44 n=1 Tax=Theileria annulata TaxID=5874 RepID=A0A3B0MFC3_THEAN
MLDSIRLESNLHSLRSFWKVSGKSNLKRITREIYFRNDLGCGVNSCNACPNSLTQRKLNAELPIIILSFEIINNNFVVLEEFLKNCVIPVTVINEIRRRSLTQYNRLKKLVKNSERTFYVLSNENLKDTFVEELPGESVSERDQRAILQCAYWYSNHLPNLQILFLTNGEDVVMDRPENLSIINLHQLYDMFPNDYEGMLERLPPKPVQNISGTEKGVYPPHLTEAEVRAGLDSGSLFSGTLHMYIGSYQRGYVSCGNHEFKVNSLIHLNRALDGDQVIVQLIDTPNNIVDTTTDNVHYSDNGIDNNSAGLEEQVGTENDDSNLIYGYLEPEQYKVIKRYCKIVSIVNRMRKEFCGSLLPIEGEVGDGYVQRLFVPVDARIPFISIETRRSKELENNRIVVEVDSWDRFSKRPNGHWTEILGPIDDRNVESTVILREHQVITEDFSLQSYKHLGLITSSLVDTSSTEKDEDKSDIKITPELLGGRVDYRDEVVFSVDPPGCKDIDDALGCKRLSNGNFEVSVHIADVTYFVPEGSNLDKEASERCTTVYLVDRRTDMLPKLLTTNLCSLMSDVNRLTFSVYWEMDMNGVILATKFSKSVIKSRRSLTYQQAQEMIDSSSNDEVSVSLRNLNNLSKILRKQRIERGAVELESSEVKFEFDMSKVEEFMLLANISVATKIFERFPKCSLLRVHPPPVEEKLNELNRTLQQQNITSFKYGNSKQLNESLEIVKNEKNDKFTTATKILTTRTMSQALYRNSNDLDEDEFKHYGLCCEYYTHFTSPIRRYADVIVHRLLASALDLAPLNLNFIQTLSGQCDLLNKRHRNAQWCSRESDKMFSYLYFKQMGDVECNGIVLDINEDRVVVLTLEYGIEAVANVEYKSFDKVNKVLVDLAGNVLKVFDQVKVKLYTCNKHFRNSIKANII